MFIDSRRSPARIYTNRFEPARLVDGKDIEIIMDNCLARALEPVNLDQFHLIT
jgi:hypothetical protein